MTPMMDTTQFLLWFFGAPAALVTIMVIWLFIEWIMCTVGDAIGRYQAQFDGCRIESAERVAWQEGRKAFLAWLEAQAGMGDMGGAIDHELVEAQRQSELIRILVEHEVPNAVSRCLETHRLMANMMGVYRYGEVAYERECYELRSRVVWLLAHGAELLQAYPCDSRMPGCSQQHSPPQAGVAALPSLSLYRAESRRSAAALSYG